MFADPTPEQVALQDTARRFAKAELEGLAAECEAQARPVPRAAMKRFAELGFLGINISEEMGGVGLGHLDAMIVLEEFAKVSVAVAFPVFESVAGPIHVLNRLADPALAQDWSRAVCRGERIVAISMSEPNAGSALTDLTTRARNDGDEIVITGQKRWCSGAGHADGYVVYCRLDDAPGAKGIGAVFVEADRRGLSFGLQEQLMGWRGVPSADMFFDDVRVPKRNLIVPAGGFAKLMTIFGLERCGNATMSLGQASGALDQALAYVSERKQFGKPIADFQAVQLKLAEMAMRVEASRLLIWRAVGRAEDLPTPADAAIAKCYANEICREVCGTALQLMGGYGYHKDYKAERRFRDAWAWGIAGGTLDIQKINIAAALMGRRFNQRG
jgi:acyl-CoA dehydrogenase